MKLLISCFNNSLPCFSAILFRNFILILIFFNCVESKAQKIHWNSNYQKPSGTWAAEWSPDNKYIALGGDDSLLQILHADSFLIRRSVKMNHLIKALSWHPDGKILAISLNNGVQLLNLYTDELTVIPGLTTGGRGLDWNYSGELLALASGRGIVEIFSKEGKHLKSIKKHNNKSYLSIHWHPNKNILLTSSDEIILFDTSGKQLNLINHRKEKTGILTARWHPSGEFFASGDYGHHDEGIETILQFWKEDGTLIKTMQGSRAEYRNIRWNKDGTLLATASDALRIWSKNGELLNTGKTSYNLWGLSWDNNGEFIFSASFGGNLDLWTNKAILLKSIY